jgi:NADPH:quinone reductase-like Zn-dependent oxidoreductase
MKAVVVHETGDPDVLSYEETDRPQPGDGEVLIRVHAASVNPADWKDRRGLMDRPLPRVLGYDASGTVESSPPRASSRATKCSACWRVAGTPSMRPLQRR